MIYEKQKAIKEEINSRFPEIWGDLHRKKQRFLYNYLRMRGLPIEEALSKMQEQGL